MIVLSIIFKFILRSFARGMLYSLFGAFIGWFVGVILNAGWSFTDTMWTLFLIYMAMDLVIKLVSLMSIAALAYMIKVPYPEAVEAVWEYKMNIEELSPEEFQHQLSIKRSAKAVADAILASRKKKRG